MDWTNRIKEDISPENEGFKHITVKRLRDIYNMDKARKDAKKCRSIQALALAKRIARGPLTVLPT